MENKTAVLFGATGLIGSYLLQMLLQDTAYSRVVVFARKRLSVHDKKLHQVITDFKDEQFLKNNILGDVAFCCLGTTIKKAGNQAAFRKVDHDLPVLLANIAFANNFPSFLVISSIGANATSSSFYLRTKGEMEKAVSSIGIQNTVLLRPSILMGKREEIRTGEAIGKIISGIIAPVLIGPLKNYKPIHGKLVAKAMLKLSHQPSGHQTLESSEIDKVAIAPEIVLQHV